MTSGEVVVAIGSALAMRQLGERIGRMARAGDLVLLTGPLGAGKTVLAQGIGAGLGVAGPVTSPTFVLARVHRGGRVPLVHVDAYRLRLGADARDQLDDLDLDAEITDSVTVVEWGDGLAEVLAPDRLEVRIERPDPDRPDDHSGRRVTLRDGSAQWPDLLLALAAGCETGADGHVDGARPSVSSPPSDPGD